MVDFLVFSEEMGNKMAMLSWLGVTRNKSFPFTHAENWDLSKYY